MSSYNHAVVLGDDPIIIGDRISAIVNNDLHEALRDNDMDYILDEGTEQQDNGVHILDVNVGIPEIDEKSMLVSVVCELQTIIDLPLMIETSDAAAMESALRRYNGKALISSVNGKRESMDKIFPLAKKYGGVIVALTLDENGIPTDAEGSLKIAEHILTEAEKYGIDKKDIVFDPITVSADGNAVEETLRAIELIKNKLGCHTLLRHLTDTTVTVH